MLAWPLLTLALFARLRPAQAATLSILGSGLLLPVGFAFRIQGLPDLDRDTIAALSVLAGVLVFHRDLLVRRPPLRGLDWLVVVMMAGAFITAMNNGDPRTLPAKYLPGITVWGGLSKVASALLFFGIPFYMGRLFFQKPRDLHWLLLALVAIGLLYSIPYLWEVRMSPHLHYWVYGYQPAPFAMSKRGFGWRPMVFVGHGLSLAVFIVSALIAAVGLWRSRSRKLGAAYLPAYFSGLLVLSSSLAATVYGLAAAAGAAFTSMRAQCLVLLVLCGLILSYPTTRARDWFPTAGLVTASASFSEARARSLAFRFDNEDILLEHSRKRPWFGWGAYGRDRVYHPVTGEDDVTTDGYWIIVLGQAGMVGFFCSFGLILWPVVQGARTALRRPINGETALVVAMAWIVALNALDLLPNAFLQSRTLFFAGALTGAVSGWERVKGARQGRATGARRPAAAPSRGDEPEPPAPPRPQAAGLGGSLLRRERF